MGKRHAKIVRDLDWTEVRNQLVLKDATEKKEAVRAQKRIRPLTTNHAIYLKAISEKTCTVCTGPWGTGKTYQAAAKAIEMLQDGTVKRIVLTRPLKECGQEMGFLPGTLYEKVVDMMMPLIESMEEFLPEGEFDAMIEDERVVIVPLEKMRGRTMKDAFVILDEAQNATLPQLKMFMSRLGSGKMVMCGDFTQSDLPPCGMNPLLEVVRRLQSEPNDQVAVIELTEEDIVRSAFARYLHRVMTKPFPVAGTHKQEKVSMVECPCCACDTWYPVRAEKENLLVKCPRCDSHIELMSGGRLDPAVIDKPDPADLYEALAGLATRPG